MSASAMAHLMLWSITFAITCYLQQIYAESHQSVATNEIEKRLTEDRIKYLPTWESLDSRPLPTWYDNAKVGIFIHWGVYSVPSFGSEWFWKYWKAFKTPEYVTFMNKNYAPAFTYQEFANDFTAELFNATTWAALFQKSGAKYVVLTSKHHEGYTMWPSKYSFSWNSVDVGPHRDIVGELSTAIRQHTDLKFGLYYSLFEWFNRMWMNDKANSFVKQEYSTFKVWPELTELINLYEPDVLWSDGDAEAPDTYWRSKEFLAWLYNESPVRDTVATNDRWGIGVMCKHGGFLTCSDRYNPGILQSRKWENAMTLDKMSWGHRDSTNFADYTTSKELITEIVTTISCGGNILVNLGPTKSGTIDAIFSERLMDMGKWLGVNGEAIYGSKPWKYQNDTITPNVWYTESSVGDQEGSTIYAMVVNYPIKNNTVKLYALTGTVRSNSKIELLGYNGAVKWENNKSYISIDFPDQSQIDHLKWAWTFKIMALY